MPQLARRRNASFFGWAALLVIALTSGAARAGAYYLPDSGDALIGFEQLATAAQEDTMLDIGRKYNVGANEIKLANPNVDTWIPGADTPVVIPTRFVIPDGEREGIVINLPEMRMYYFPKEKYDNRRIVVTYPISVGRGEWETPQGATKVIAKQENPSWYPPASIRKEHAEAGDPLPAVVPPGPDNPLGEHSLRLALPGYLIHGTNKPFGIGMRVTHGCIRMYPENIKPLYENVPLGTPVRIVHQPYKVGWWKDQLYVEVHTPDEVDPPIDEMAYLALVREKWAQKYPADSLDLAFARKLLTGTRGMPVRMRRQDDVAVEGSDPQPLRIR